MPAYSRILLPWDSQPQEPAQINADSWQSQGLLRWWPLNGYTNDPAGNQNGTLTSGAAFRVVTEGKSAFFDGSDDYIALTSKTLPIGNTFTFSFWSYLPTLPGTSRWTVWGCENAAGGFQLEVGSTGTTAQNNAVGTIYAGLHGYGSGNSVLVANTWQHFVFTITANVTDSELFLNGALLTPSYRNSQTYTDNATGNIGRRTAASQLFSGYLRDLRFYNYRMSAAQVAKLYFDKHELFAPRSIWIPVSAGGGGVNLVIADSAHAHAADNIGLTLDTYLALQDALHAHSADNLGLTLDTYLAVNEALHAHTADNLTLSTTGSTDLTVADAAHAHAADNLGLTLDTFLTIAEALHAHSADNLTLSTGAVANLVIADGAHAHAADNLAFTLDTWLAIADALHAHGADNLILTLLSNLTIADATHAHTADNVVLAFPLGALSDAEFRQMYDWLNELQGRNLLTVGTFIALK